MLTVKVDAFELRKLVLDTNMPITDDVWEFLNDIDLEHTDRVVFITKDGKEVEFVKTGDATIAKKNETVGHLENYLTEGKKEMMLTDKPIWITDLINNGKLEQVYELAIVRHGHWENYLREGLRWKCSECGSRFETPYHYCPNCGTKMDEVSE